MRNSIGLHTQILRKNWTGLDSSLLGLLLLANDEYVNLYKTAAVAHDVFIDFFFFTFHTDKAIFILSTYHVHSLTYINVSSLDLSNSNSDSFTTFYTTSKSIIQCIIIG